MSAPKQDALARRGRSRQVPASARERQADDERRTATAIHAVQHKFFVIPTPEPDADADDDDDPPARPPPTMPAAGSSRASPAPLSYRSQRSSFSSIHSALSTPSSSSTMLSIAAPVPLKAAVPPPFMRSASPSPPSSASMSPDFYDSPPSPPRSLEDQVHVAYALDDIHLAKILLLRLKGIEVTSDDDPRIAAVQDEDFDFCFVPNGALMDEYDEKAMQEMQAREMALIEQRRRVLRLKDCERKFDDGKRRLREQRLASDRRRLKEQQQEEDARRRAVEREQRRAAEEEHRKIAHERAVVADMHRTAQRSRSRKIVSYRFLQTPPSNTQPKHFVYDFPGYPARSGKPMPAAPTCAPQPQQPPVFDDACAVPFTEVLKSMQGPLFPLSHADRPRRSDSPAFPKSKSRTPSQVRRRREARLLEALLVDIEYSEDERRKLKGKQPENGRRIFAPCLACSAASSPQSSLSAASPPPIRRTSSWLSFRGTNSSASSSTTDLTTPSSSPISSSKVPWFIMPKSTLSDAVLPTLLHSCHQRTRLMPVALSDSPLYIEAIPPTRLEPLSHLGRQRSTSTVRAAREGAGALVRRMSKFVELAKGLQTAYASAALFGLDERAQSPVSRPASRASRTPPTATTEDGTLAPRGQRVSRPKLRPAGYRAAVRDVARFRDPTLGAAAGAPSAAPGAAAAAAGLASDVANGTAGRYIPLTAPLRANGSPRTVLPDPLPYALVFKRVLSPSRSPFRFHALSELHTVYPSSAPSPPHVSGAVTWRIRSVGNPVHMRLKALRNVVRAGGMAWEGAGSDTALGGGRERVIGVAYENLGATKLNRTASSSSLN